jgi:hypothetical protein
VENTVENVESQVKDPKKSLFSTRFFTKVVENSVETVELQADRPVIIT